jgi:short-subunit dehydrogenase
MQKDLSGLVVVLTGASSGFGKGAALKFAQNGVNLVLAARRDYLLDELVKTCEAAGCQAIAVPTDVSKKEEVENLAAKAIEKFGRIDVWINNAGAAVVGNFTDAPLDDHIQVIETDLIGTINGSYFALKHFVGRDSGILINVASMIGKVPAPYYASYAAAKHGVVGLCAALRQELKAQNHDQIHVCTVMPMAMDTPFFSHAANYTGKESVAIPPLDDAQKVIDTLVELVSNPRDEVPVGAGGLTNVIMHNIAPGVSEAMMGTITHKAQIEDAPPAPDTAGNLRETTASGTGVKDPKIAKN